MATLEELTVEAQAEVDAAKPLMKNVDGEVRELTEEEYAQRVIDTANSKWEIQQFSYKELRQAGYGSIQDQLDMQYWDLVNGTTVWKDHIAQVKSDNPKPE
jgi:hypothetical protein